MSTRATKTEVLLKWKAFAKYFVQGVKNDETGAVVKRNGAAAARAAGFSKGNAASQASRMLKMVEVQELINEEEAKEVRDLRFTEDFIVENLLEVLRRCMQAEPVMVDGIQTGVWQFDAKNAMVSLDKLGRHIGMWSKVSDDSRARDAMSDAKKRADAVLQEIEQATKRAAGGENRTVNLEVIRGGTDPGK